MLTINKYFVFISVSGYIWKALITMYWEETVLCAKALTAQ